MDLLTFINIAQLIALLAVAFLMLRILQEIEDERDMLHPPQDLVVKVEAPKPRKRRETKPKMPKPTPLPTIDPRQTDLLAQAQGKVGTGRPMKAAEAANAMLPKASA